jgi:hypothetical protein
MTIIDEILICANQLANAGKKPTVALVKAKLSQPAPLPTLITTLKSWQHQPDFISPINNEAQQITEVPSSKDTAALLESLLEDGSIKKVIQQSLESELTAIKSELTEMKLLINDLAKQLSEKE